MVLWFLTGYNPSLQPRKEFFNGKIVEKCTKIECIEKSMIKFFLTVDCLWNHINEWHQVTKWKNFDFIFICPEDTAQTRWCVSILLWSIAARHLTRRKICDGFWLPGTKSFPMVYNMYDFAAIISSCYYTLMFFIQDHHHSKDSTCHWNFQKYSVKII